MILCRHKCKLCSYVWAGISFNKVISFTQSAAIYIYINVSTEGICTQINTAHFALFENIFRLGLNLDGELLVFETYASYAKFKRRDKFINKI